MDNSTLKYFKIIGEIQTIIAKANTLEEALKGGLKSIMQSCGVDYAVFWYKDVDEILHPYYWICPKDFSLKKYKTNEGIVGKVYSLQQSIRLLDYQNNHQEEIDNNFSGIKISSYICAPVSNKYENIGCIEFIKENTLFSQEEADICEMLTTLTAIQVDDNEKFNQKFEERKPILSAINVKKQFINGEFVTRVLKGVNLDVYEGELLVLLGESGCGKSTLLNAISGMDKIDEGKIIFEGKDISNYNQNELTKYRRDNIGFIFQSYNLMPNLNVKNNLSLISELVDKPMDINEVLKLVKLDDKGHNYPSQLSGGQQQRVSIARALVKNPKIIMADEPTAALDYETSIEVLSALENVSRKGTTIVMVTHNEEITKMANRVVRMRNGKTYEVTINRHPLHASDLVW